MGPNPPQNYFLSNKVYDVLKFLAQIGLPALGTLYFALAGIWGLPAAEQVVGTIVAIDTFLGVLLGISTSAYDKSDAKFDGTMEVGETPEGKSIFSLNLNEDPEILENKEQIVFKVKPL